MVEVKTLLPMNLHRTAPRALATLGHGDRAPSVFYARAGHALAAPRASWAGRRPPEWARMLGLGSVGHCGYGLRCSPLKQCTFLFSLGLFQMDFKSNSI
jgi:hypothetical protein